MFMASPSRAAAHYECTPLFNHVCWKAVHVYSDMFFISATPGLCSRSKNSLISLCRCSGRDMFVLRLQNVNKTDSFARDNATKNVHLSSSDCLLKFQKAESSNPTKYTALYSSPLLLWIVMIGIEWSPQKFSIAKLKSPHAATYSSKKSFSNCVITFVK